MYFKLDLKTCKNIKHNRPILDDPGVMAAGFCLRNNLFLIFHKSKKMPVINDALMKKDMYFFL